MIQFISDHPCWFAVYLMIIGSTIITVVDRIRRPR
jgi:hypothetical protein